MSATIGLERLGIQISDLRRGRTVCPNCSESRKKSRERCLWVDVESGNYKCHHCGWEGRADSNEWIRNNETHELPTIAQYKTPEDNFKNANGVAAEYLQSRGIPDEVISRNKIGETPRYVVFRYYNNGKLIRAKMRDVSEKRFTQIPDCRPSLYKIDDIKETKYCIITEGEIDALSFDAAGLPEAVSLDAGAVSPGQEPGKKFSCLIDAMPFISGKERIYIAMDADEKGEYTAGKLAEFLGIDKCYKVTYPEGCKDANDVLCKHGPEALRGCVRNARQFRETDLLFSDPLLKKAIETEFDYTAKVEKIPAVLEVRTSGQCYDVAALGQIGIFSGHEKSGKSFVLECIAASGIGGGHPKINFSLNLGDKKILWFDTEQSHYFYQINQRRIHDLAGVYSNTKFYRAYHLRKFTAEERVKIIETLIYSTPDLGAVVIDGFVDLLKDYNDLIESQEMVNRLMRWTDEKKILLMGVLHLNKGDGKLRGHIGSELKNKCDFQITVSKDQEAYEVANPTSRYISFPGFTFCRQKDGMPVVEEESPF